MGLINWNGLSPMFVVILFAFFIFWAKGFYSILVRLVRYSKIVALLMGLVLATGIILALIPIESPDKDGISKPMVVVLFIYFWLINPIVCVFGVFELISVLKRQKSGSSFNKQRREFLKGISVYSLAFLNLGIFTRPLLMPCHDLKTREFHLNLNAQKGLNIGFISDLHAGFYLSDAILEKVVFEMTDKKPDFIFIGGDIVDHSANDLIQLEKFVELLTKICPVVSVLGNHDIISGGDKVQRYLKSKGVIVLRDQSIEITDGVVICGLRDEKQEKIDTSFIRQIDDGKSIIVLSHSPKAIYKLSDDELKKVGLFLAGHTHGGQIRLSNNGSLINPGGLEFQPGLIRISNQMPPMIITSGIGYTGIPLRINCEPEVVFVKII